jgi:RecJ-like exonuclease
MKITLVTGWGPLRDSQGSVWEIDNAEILALLEQSKGSGSVTTQNIAVQGAELTAQASAADRSPSSDACPECEGEGAVVTDIASCIRCDGRGKRLAEWACDKCTYNGRLLRKKCGDADCANKEQSIAARYLLGAP